SFSLSDIQRLKDQAGQQSQAKPQSEFEDLRSELGGVFALGEDAPGGQSPSGGPRQAPPQGPPPPPPSQRPPSSPPPPPPPSGPSYTTPKPQPSAQGGPGAGQDAQADRFERDLFDKKDKPKSPAALIIVMILVLVALGGSGWYAYTNFLKPSSSKPKQAATPVTSEPEVPQVTVETDSSTKDTMTAVEEVEKKPEPVARKAKPPRSRPAPTRRASRPKPKPVTRRAPSPPPVANKLQITSSPSAAVVTIDGERRGTTPYTWENPSVYGSVSIEVSRAGYQTEKRSTDYTGGSKSEHFALNEKPERTAPPPAPAPAPKPKPKPEPEAVASTTPSSEPAETSPKPTPTRQSAPPPSTPQSQPAASTGGGAPGTIFIASIPPVADVYMNGEKIGRTNIAELKITAGTHTMRFVKGGKEITKSMTFKAGKNPSQMVKIP
ncbi:MAG: PEGA domain-containing protein, partial [Chitinivibrionales bacterium]|nr:PEGA domain-containing protein [Chitinivibrionales bacterium]MBD3357271.1 PEGA domain-containing protein [Chitinivibrionales bacterium]